MGNIFKDRFLNYGATSKMFSYVNILSPDELDKIHNATMEIMETVGVLFHHDKAITLFEKNGFKVDGNKVFFTEKQVMDTIAQCPRKFLLRGRNPEKNVMLGAGDPVFGAGSGYIKVISPEGQRPATLQDTITYSKLLQSSQFVHLHGCNLVSASDVPAQIAVPHTMLFACLLSDKPMMGLGYVDEFIDISLDMMRMIFGNTDDHVCMGMTNPTSPLAWDDNMIELIFKYVEAGQPIEMGCLGMMGSTHPIYRAGSLALSNAELLAGVVFTQLIRPGVPVVPGVISTMSDMKTMNCVMGASDEAVMTAAYAQIAHHYGLPSRGGGALTDAKSCDTQAGSETIMNLMLPMMSGMDLMLHIGMCDSFNSISYEKFILDEDMLALANSMKNGVKVSDETLCLDEIKKNGPGTHFLTSPSTLANCRTALFQPQLFNRDSHDALMAKNSLNIQEKATAIWQDRVENFTPPEMDPALKSDLWEYVESKFGKIDSELKALV